MRDGQPPAGQASRPTFWHQARLPLTAVSDHPWEFIEWVLGAVLLGSIGIWLVPLVVPDPNTMWRYSWYHSVATGHVAGFSVVLLAEMMSWGFPYSIRFSGRQVEPPRGAATIIAFVLVLIHAAFLVGLARASALHQATLVISQVILFVPSIAIACYLVCFRLRDNEPSVALMEAREADDVKRLDARANTITQTSDGDKL